MTFTSDASSGASQPPPFLTCHLVLIPAPSWTRTSNSGLSDIALLQHPATRRYTVIVSAQRLRMVWRRKRRSAGRPQPSLPPRPARPSPQTRRESSACAHPFSPPPYFMQDHVSKSSFDGVSLVSDKNECKTESKNDSKIERKKSSSSSQYKANLHFHKLFLDVPTEEPLRQSFTCALQKEILYQGKLFVSENWICFYSKVFGKDTKISIPAFSVTLIKKTKTALLVPNALIIATVTDKYIFVSLLSRDSTYKLLKSVCGHLDNTSVGNSPNPSSLENSFRADRFRTDRPSSLPLDFNDEFSDLDGVVQQRRQDLGGYSSSGSQTPESENSRDFHVTESQTVLSVSKGEAKPTRTDVQMNRAPEGKAKSLPAHGQSESIGILHKVKSQNRPTLRHILIFYAVVVCALIFSTFYMRYRINTLEEQLGSLTSIMDTHHAEQAAPSSLGSQVQLNAEALCRELTANIMKLEKIQNNLQKLLENGD
ncbi:GRAM domain-containing protein 2B isoform X3 [Myotis myotis]|nr:GRAM domain-containing protein 2B isoform X3 [Myotis myotis]